MLGSVPATGVRGHGVVAKGGDPVPAARPVPASVTHAGLGVARITGGSETATALRDVASRSAAPSPTAIALAGVAPVVRAVVGRQRVIRRAMVPGVAPRSGRAAALLAGKPAAEARRSTRAPIHASRRIRKAALSIASARNGAVATTPPITASAVVIDPVPTGVRDLPASGLASAAALLGPTSGRATTASILEAAGSGPVGHPSLPSGVGGRVVPVAVRVARGSVLAVLRDLS